MIVEIFHDCGKVSWLWKCFMIVESFMILEMFHDCEKTFLTAEKMIGLIILKQWRHIVFDSVIIKLPLLILSVLTKLYSLMIKTKGYQHVGLLRMQFQNQWEASSMTVESFFTVEHLLQGGLGIQIEPSNIPLFVRGRLGMWAEAHLKCLSPLRKSSTSLGKGWVGSTW